MEVENNVAFYSRLVANGALIQLLACFLLASRSDPYAVAPLIALYSTRESDRRAMMLYFVVTCIAPARWQMRPEKSHTCLDRWTTS